MKLSKLLLGIVWVLMTLSSYAQEKKLFKKNTKIDYKPNSSLYQDKSSKKDDLDDLPPLTFRTEEDSKATAIQGSELQERKYEPLKIVNPSISNFDTTSIDEGEALVVEIEEENAPIGSEDFVTVASYYSVWDTKTIDPYDINAKEFDEPVDLELYNLPAGRNWSPPLSTVKQTSPFGPRWGRLHAGVDLDLETGYPVFAPFDGIVRVVNYDSRGYGKFMVLRHYNGLETLFGHLSKQGLEPGTLVKAGDEIGLGGNTGRSTGSHLHFETRYEGNPFNPNQVYNFGSFEPISDHLLITAQTFNMRALALRNEFGSVGEKVRSRKKVWTKVRPGDSLYVIAQRAGVSASKLAKLNGLKMTSTIRAGRRLRIH
ncbi:MAG: peptidoglycan DD-metalloendopeptidase family protein [Aquirufa sp.]